MKIVSLELENFRRFRAPLRLAGFTGGLNVVVEPNETGKSTLLEALRAALFVRHSARTELTRSYCPTGDDVAPKVAVEFDVAGERWTIEKQFLRSSRVQLAGPRGRFESDAAEEQLQALLGFERGNNRGTDHDTRGALGMLWVEQASALRVDEPNRLVRNNVRTALESEVGAITGGRRFDLILQRVEDAYGEFRTGTRSRSTGRLAAAEIRMTAARERRETLVALASAHEATLTKLEEARGARRRVERELGDEEQVRLRDQLAVDLKLGESAAEKLATARARFDVANAAAERLDERVAAITAVEAAVVKAGDGHQRIAALVAEHGPERDAAITREAERRQALADARQAHTAAAEAVRAARDAVARRDRAAAVGRARARLVSLDALEQELADQERVAGQGIATKDLEGLAKLDKAVVEARAVVSAGAVRVEVVSRDGTAVRIDGDLAGEGPREVTSETVFEVGVHATIRVMPPASGSATAQLQAAEAALANALSRQGAASYPDAMALSNAAKIATQAVNASRRQIETLCAADPVLGLGSGASALRGIASEASAQDGDYDATIDIGAAEAELARIAEAERLAVGRHNAAVIDLHTVEQSFGKLGIELAGAQRDETNARAQLAALLQAKPKAELETDLIDARGELAARLREKAAAEQAVGAFDVERLRIRIGNIDKATAGAGERKLGLIEKIAGLEATIESEGAMGLAGQVDAAREEEAAAEQGVGRLTVEADTLELLRTTLREAQETASRTFLGPVTKRAVQYVRRILPDCDVTFTEELGLTSIVRGGISEGCGDLSRGTQEQLAVLTRLAFADMLLDKGEPVSLILDDPLVYSDDARLETMTEILTGAAERMQVILLTCRERAFRHLSGNRVTI